MNGRSGPSDVARFAVPFVLGRIGEWIRSDETAGIRLSVFVVLLFAVAKAAMLLGVVTIPGIRLSLLGLACLLALRFSDVRASALPGPVQFVYRGVIGLFACYLALVQVPVVSADLSTWHLAESWAYGWGAAALGVLALWRISWAVPFFMAAKWQKAMFSEALEIRISPTDYSAVLEFGLTLALGGLAYEVTRRAYGWWRDWEGSATGPSPLETVFLTAVAVHFSNYFYSGIQKIRISEPWWQWVVENPTYNLGIVAWEIGNLPVRMFGDDVAARTVELHQLTVVPLNAGILLLQLLAIVAIARIRWAMIMTAIYDVTHVGIFLASGIFFYKWIWLNLLLVIALGRMGGRKLSAPLATWLMGVVLVAPTIYFVVFLGWFDSASLNHERVEAIDADGRVYQMPTNYFLAGSITHAQQSVVTRKTGHFQNYAYGVITRNDLGPSVFEDAQRCALPVATESGAIAPEAKRISRILHRHHNYVLSVAGADGTIEYDWYPHHIFSIPVGFEAFDNLDKRRIAAYRYVLESKCLDFKGGRPVSETVLRGELLVPVD